MKKELSQEMQKYYNPHQNCAALVKMGSEMVNLGLKQNGLHLMDVAESVLHCHNMNSRVRLAVETQPRSRVIPLYEQELHEEYRRVLPPDMWPKRKNGIE